MSRRFFLITGCSGGGKSTLLSALEARGYATVSEPGRRIVSDARRGRAPFPSDAPEAFAHLALHAATADLIAARRQQGPVFFDRGTVDALVALDQIRCEEEQRHYAKTAFLAPPWRALYVKDRDRRHGFEDAVAEYHRIRAALSALGYSIAMLPRSTVAARVRLVLTRSIAPSRPAR